MKVYVDLDGVLADFFSAAAKLSNAEHKGWRDMEFRDVDKALKKIRKMNGFFLGLEPFCMANTLVASIVNISGGYSVLSSPLTDYKNCAEEKIEWVKNNIHFEPDEIIITDNKPVYAKGNVLIDDYGANCRAWEKAGGYAIKYQSDEQHISDVITPLQALFKSQL